jgi:c-di-GMP-binding flagellar brake protein YcgR
MGSENLIPHFFLSKYRQKSPLFVESLLHMLSFEKTPVLFLFDSHIRLVYTSMVLGVDREGGTLLLDALHPDMGNDHLVPGTPVTFFGRAKGIETGFRSRILGTASATGGRAVRLVFPSETYYLQRRSALRVPLPPGMPPVCVRKTSGAMEEIRPVDIGGGGLRGLYPEKTLLGQPNLVFEEEDLVLMEGVEFDNYRLPPVSGRVAHIEHSGKEAGEELAGVGIEFLDFPPEYQEDLITYVSRRDRELLRNFRLEPGK